MDYTGTCFPESHTDSEKMTRLAEAEHTVYGFDVVMPLFSVWHESDALGCPVDWGWKDSMPDCRTAIYKDDSDTKIPEDFLKKPGCKVPLESIKILKKRLGNDTAICGKVFDPWTLGYHVLEFRIS